MCVIIASPMGKPINDGIIEDGANANRDGGGVAWLDQAAKKIRWKKGLDANEVKKLLATFPEKTPHVVHFRISTVGGVNDELTHPFSIDERASIETEGEADSVLFHNGCVGHWKEYLFQVYISSGLKVPPPPWSDTRAMAILAHIYGPHILSLVESGSRFLIMDARGDSKNRMTRWGNWHDIDGLSFSNRSTRAFEPPKVVTQPTQHTYERSFPDRRGSMLSMRDRRATIKYTPPTGTDPWKNLTHDGCSIKAVNEDEEDAALVAPIQLDIVALAAADVKREVPE